MYVFKDSMWREIWKILQNFLGSKAQAILYDYCIGAELQAAPQCTGSDAHTSRVSLHLHE